MNLITLAELEVRGEVNAFEELLTTARFVVNEALEVQDQNGWQLFERGLTRCFDFLAGFGANVASQRLFGNQAGQGIPHRVDFFIL